MLATRAVEYARISDLMDAYFAAVRDYNLALGAFDMTAEQLADARAREALNYAKVRKLKQQLAERGVAV